ncbi:hypothetical protein FPRO05_12165 [Fusarium proliferatum]|uniref:Carrier domain-containing protein n=1 Tax=Gibberella intermedia TaxID=948311 RepID=A0A365N555_GIBIN|nr:hypothetical protein FPRO05_12165 [Fusarium proliferatum]
MEGRRYDGPDALEFLHSSFLWTRGRENLVVAGADDRVRSLNKIARLVPGVEAMRQLGGTHDVSISNFFQGAWAFVLRAFTGSEDVCFGYLTSGRNFPVDRIVEIVGPLISMLVSSTDSSMGNGAASALELLQAMNHRTGDLISYCSEGKSKRFTFVRRKDTQVKARGQRIELGEMYQRITRNLTDNDPEAGPESAHSPVEQIISEAVAWVINLPGQFSMRHSFIGMGGDSITAMQAMALCRRRGVSLPVQDIFKSANITVMAAKAQHLSSCDDSANDEDELAPFLLSPIQKLHLQQFPHGENHYNHID